MISEEKQALYRKIFDVSGSVFNWYRKNNSFLGEQCFFDPKVLKECFGYHFHCFLVSSDKYVKNIFDEIFFVYIPF